MKSKSDLDIYVEQIKTWATGGLNNHEIVEQLSLQGVDTSESSIRRLFKRNKIEIVEEAKPKVISTPIQRAARHVEGTATAEDKLRDEVDTLTREKKEAEQIIKRLREEHKFEDKITQTIEKALINTNFSKPVLSQPKINTSQSDAHELLLMISDAHYGEVVNPEEALGIKYDPEICRKRIEHMRDVTFRIAELRKTAYPFQKITLASLGDMVSGVIHEELEVTNQVTMVEQTSEMAHILFNLAKDASEVFPEVELIVKVGNHPRLHKKPRFKNKYDNWEYMMGQMIKGMAQYALPNVTVTVPKDLVYVHDIFDYKIGMVHGDGVKSNSFAGIPFYGLRNQREAVQALMSQTGHPRIDMFMMGHFHQYMFWGGECDIIINGSIKGGDEFGIGTRLSAPDPEQILLEFHPEHGLTTKNKITLGHIQ